MTQARHGDLVRGASKGAPASALRGRRREGRAFRRLLERVGAGRSQVLVLRGEAGVGKSALLEYLAEGASECRVVRAAGVASETQLAYAGLHQLCGPLLELRERLPAPQRDALATVFGLDAEPAPDPFLIGLATLTLLSAFAEQQPLLCIVDDAQWLDPASEQILGFVARRLVAEPVAIVCASRTGIGDPVLEGLPEWHLRGLNDDDALALLLDNVHGPIDAAVCEQIVMESHGNPLALLGLRHSWSTAEVAGGFGLPGSEPAAGNGERSYARRLSQLPSDTQLLVLAAAADPLGDPVLLHRAVGTLGLVMSAANPAVDAGLLKIGRRV